LKNLKNDFKKDAAPFLPRLYNYGREYEIAMGGKAEVLFTPLSERDDF